MLSEWLRKQTRGVVNGVAAVLAKSGVTPNQLTVVGFLLISSVGVLLARGMFREAGVLIIVTALFDALDGGLARYTNRVTPFGAFLDSTLDRYAEAALYGGLLWWYMQQGAHVEAMLVYAAIVGSIMVSYTRARAEGIGVECKVGLFTRFERIAVLVFALLFNLLTPALVVLAIFSNVTALQRMWHVYRQAQTA
ncbi:MAG: CDP-alcohol phosphatidyltransferase family protein [Ardenticatenia bacterium]|uniref:CDP-diacylglycerol--glycerol-3-phosphate 3-phosphatidyltransferase n=1 Tax=Ardenticatena maritima TaxID=872965 RepID=A0A0M9UCY0_9CHLR|nr:CDP-alcohol phosphatidyltransferase family protein [Ardenticatena maritima]KPL88421.1 hypothetical protein SE16_06350 [Ardenticatena maritima]RME11373.1 MAG: CDP-alcohol phosphatidyltransferase family protein [Ardenticatenia bacterium]GAP63437.1 CDP-diacylglycerol--glycerol-3-phosphate 3-phosphatidyltransferase [Ardenticatena maritima]